MTRSGNLQFFTVSIPVLADSINSQVHPNVFDSFLHTFSQIEEQILYYFKNVRVEFSAERKYQDLTNQQPKSEQGTFHYFRSKFERHDELNENK